MIRDSLEKYARGSLTIRRMVRWYFTHTGYYNWRNILIKDRGMWQAAIRKSTRGPNILIATSIGFHLPSITLESLLAVALTLRKTNVHVLLCDSVLPACHMSESNWYPEQLKFIQNGNSRFFCRNCFIPGYKMYQALDIEVHRYSDFLTDQDFTNAERISSEIPFSDIGNYMFENIAVGEHALAGALRFFARGNFEGEPFAEPVVRQYLKASLLSTFAIRTMLKKFNYEAAVFNHGIYVPQGLIGEVCRQENVRVVNWNPAYRKRCFIFSHHDTYHHTMMAEPVEKWKDISWNENLETGLMDYLRSRWEGSQDWIWFHKKPNFKLQQIVNDLGINLSKPCIGMLTSVTWDAVLHYPSHAFPNMLDWIIRTINYFTKRPDLQLIIRVHPAEIHGAFPSRQGVADEIKKVYPELPGNIIVIPPESNISTYRVMLNCDSVIIYNTKMGVELTAMGIPVIVAGEAWIRNKGFAIDVDSPEAYFKILDKLPFKKRMSPEDTEDAKRYAYHFFFRRMIPLEFMKPNKGWPPYRIQLRGLEDLMPDSSRGLDIICKGIMDGTDFIYPAEYIST